ncbi:MAG: hypothetical protein HY744_02875 [Deltaproteobacteria bacterium]|nr:hypothetical protein [Deltaproteobacteria bacterium]
MTEPGDLIPPSEPSVESIEELDRDERRSQRRVLLVLAAVVPVLLLGGGYAWWRSSHRAGAHAVTKAWSLAAACLAGAPLRPGERPSLRARAIELGAATRERDHEPDMRWPHRCADLVASLATAWRQHGRDEGGADGLGPRAERLAVALGKAESVGDLGAAIDDLFDSASRLHLVAEPVALWLATPEPVHAPGMEALPEGALLTPRPCSLERASIPPLMGPELHVLLGEPRRDCGALLCTFTARGDDRCRELGPEPASKSPLRLAGTAAAGATPLLFAGRDGEDGIYRADSGEKVAALRAQAAYVSAGGYVAIASAPLAPDGRFELVEQAAPGARPVRASIEPQSFSPRATRIHRKQILWDLLLVDVQDERDERSRPRLQFRRLPAGGKPEGFAPVAELDWGGGPVLGCRTEQMTVARVGGGDGMLLFHSGQSWSAPLAFGGFPAAFGCDSGEAVFTGPQGEQQRCTRERCQERPGVAPSFEPLRLRDLQLADLGGKILAVALGARRGGVRYRHAEGKDLALPAADRVLFDDLVQDGAVRQQSAVQGVLLAGRGGFAVLLVATPGGVYALRFDAEGRAAAAKIGRKAE